MAAVTSDFVRSLTAMCRAVYADAFAAAGGVYQSIATVIPSTQASETYAWLGEVPTMREWLDERQLSAVKEYGFTITNKKWEATVAIQREAIEDDQTGQIKMRILRLAEAASAHYDRMLFDVINANPLAHDGVAFYHATHNNLATGAGSALSAASLEAGVAAMRSQRLPNGEPMDVRPTHLLVPPALEFTARRLLNSAYYPDDSGASAGPGGMSRNPLQGVLELLVSNRLTTPTEWHLFDAGHAVKPFILQQRVVAEFDALDDAEKSETAFLRDEFLYGVRSRDNAGPGLFYYAYKAAGA